MPHRDLGIHNAIRIRPATRHHGDQVFHGTVSNLTTRIDRERDNVGREHNVLHLKQAMRWRLRLRFMDVNKCEGIGRNRSPSNASNVSNLRLKW